MNRHCLNTLEQRSMFENEDMNSTEAEMINVIYVTWITVLTAHLTFLPHAHIREPPSNQRLMTTLVVLILTLDPIDTMNSTAQHEQLEPQNQLVKNKQTSKTFKIHLCGISGARQRL